MRALIQRVNNATVHIDNKLHSSIGAGLLVLLGIENADTEADIDWLCKKILQLRIFNDEQNMMNKSVLDLGLEIMLVSQFTLFAQTKKGNRPSFIQAAKPEIAIPLYNLFIKKSTEILGKRIQTGVFGADMQINLINDGPVTIWIDSKNRD